MARNPLEIGGERQYNEPVSLGGPFVAYRTTLRLLVLLCLPLGVQAQSPELSKTVQESVRVHAPRILLTHVRVIEGAGKPAIEDRNVVIEGGKIRAIQAGADVSRPGNSAAHGA